MTYNSADHTGRVILRIAGHYIKSVVAWILLCIDTKMLYSLDCRAKVTCSIL